MEMDNDGYYIFLYPLLESLANSSGKYIDLYGDATFKGDELVFLEVLIREAEQLISDKPEKWSVLIGTEYYPNQKESKPKEIYGEVVKKKMVNLLNNMNSLIKEARETNNSIIFFGD